MQRGCDHVCTSDIFLERRCIWYFAAKRFSPLIHLIQLTSVTKRFTSAGPAAVDDVSLDVAEGEVLALLGGSGSGKSTTLRMINRLIEPTAGEIRLDGRNVLDEDPVVLRRGIGYVFQSVGLFPHLTIAENVALPLRLIGRTKTEQTERIAELLNLVHLDPAEFGPRRPRELSGGQRQRVGFARALASQSRVMLLDEPFGALDPVTRDSLQSEFRALQRRLGFTAVLVTHDMSEALLLADRIAVMRQGRLLRIGTPRELLAEPGDEYVAELLSAPKRQAALLAKLSQEGEA